MPVVLRQALSRKEGMATLAGVGESSRLLGEGLGTLHEGQQARSRALERGLIAYRRMCSKKRAVIAHRGKRGAGGGLLSLSGSRSLQDYRGGASLFRSFQ